MKRCIFITSLLLAILSIIITGCTFEGDVEALGKVPLKVDFTGYSSLPRKLEWLDENAKSGNIYIIDVTENSNVSKVLKYDGEENITIRIIGNGRLIGPSSNNSVFEVGSGVTLVLDGISLGFFMPSVIDYPMIKVSQGGILVMNKNSRIFGNAKFEEYGFGGVLVDGGTFIMNGGEIYENSAPDGGGVFVNDGIFIMNGGIIRDNEAQRGGAVSVKNGGTFTINGDSIIRKNMAKDWGGGVFVQNANFFKKGGIIFGADTDTDESDKNFVSGGDYSGHAVAVIIGSGGLPPQFFSREDTIGKNETLSLSLKGTAWTPEGNWNSPP